VVVFQFRSFDQQKQWVSMWQDLTASVAYALPLDKDVNPRYITSITGSICRQLALSCFLGHLPKKQTILRLRSGGYVFQDQCWISIAYSPLRIAVAISPDPCGVDIENIRPVTSRDKLLQRICSDEEMSILYKSADGICNLKVLWVWTRKEALAKSMQLGLSCNLKSLNVCDPYKISKTHFMYTKYDVIQGFIYSYCFNEMNFQPSYRGLYI